MYETTDANRLQGLRAALPVAVGHDRFGVHRRLGPNTIDYKVTSQDSTGLLIFELTTHVKGGPERHRHLAQDEWFYVLEGQFVIEVGSERFRPRPGDALLAPRGVPHGWAHLEDVAGKFLTVFNPAGKMEAFFRDMAQSGSMAPPDPAVFRRYELEWVGPPLSIEA